MKAIKSYVQRVFNLGISGKEYLLSLGKLLVIVVGVFIFAYVLIASGTGFMSGVAELISMFAYSLIPVFFILLTLGRLEGIGMSKWFVIPILLFAIYPLFTSFIGFRWMSIFDLFTLPFSSYVIFILLGFIPSGLFSSK